MKNPALRRLCGMALFLLLGNLANAQLKAAFTATPLSGCSPLLVSFTDASTGNPDQWEWDLGNGTTSFFQNPSVTYFNPGTYTVSLVASNASGASTAATRTITVAAMNSRRGRTCPRPAPLSTMAAKRLASTVK